MPRPGVDGPGKREDAIAAYIRAIELDAIHAPSLNNVAWHLATSADPENRDPRRAVELAKKLVDLTRLNETYWNTLGVAQYRTGDWQAAIDAFRKSEELAPGEFLSFNAFFLAMAHWWLGKKEKAAEWFSKAVDWMEKHAKDNEELVRFKAEAEELLGKK